MNGPSYLKSNVFLCQADLKSTWEKDLDIRRISIYECGEAGKCV